jgi:HSP20 family protein
MTTLTEPFSPLYQLSRDIDRLLGRNGGLGGFVPAADVVVGDADVTVTMDVPGIQADDLVSELENDVLTVRGERSHRYASDGRTHAWERIERGIGRFERSLQVPRGLDPDAVEASLEAGVLTLRIPKPEQLKPKRVQIAAGRAEGAPQIESATGRAVRHATRRTMTGRRLCG